jgi:hypothetical protein
MKQIALVLALAAALCACSQHKTPGGAPSQPMNHPAQS